MLRDEPSRRVPQLRKHFADDALGERRIHQDPVYLGIQGRPMTPLQLDQRGRVSLDDPAQQISVGDRRAVGP